MQIFIVDDDEMLATALEDYLTRKTPHRISVFQTGEDCLARIAESPESKPSIVVLDYYLNSVSREAANGMEILKALKKQCPRAHVIMLSGQERYGVALQSIQKGAEQYVLKGRDAFDEIVSMIAAIKS